MASLLLTRRVLPGIRYFSTTSRLLRPTPQAFREKLETTLRSPSEAKRGVVEDAIDLIRDVKENELALYQDSVDTFLSWVTVMLDEAGHRVRFDQVGVLMRWCKTVKYQDRKLLSAVNKYAWEHLNRVMEEMGGKSPDVDLKSIGQILYGLAFLDGHAKELAPVAADFLHHHLTIQGPSLVMNLEKEMVHILKSHAALLVFDVDPPGIMYDALSLAYRRHDLNLPRCPARYRALGTVIASLPPSIFRDQLLQGMKQDTRRQKHPISEALAQYEVTKYEDVFTEFGVVDCAMAISRHEEWPIELPDHKVGHFYSWKEIDGVFPMAFFHSPPPELIVKRNAINFAENGFLKKLRKRLIKAGWSVYISQRTTVPPISSEKFRTSRKEES